MISSSFRWLSLLLLLGVPCSLAASIEEGWQLYQAREFDSAIREFHKLHISAKPGDKTRLSALYGEAHCWNYRLGDRQPERARALYEQLLAEAPPEHVLRSWSALEIAQSFHLSEPPEGRNPIHIIERYRDVYERYPDTAAGQEAWVAAIMLDASSPQSDPAALIGQVEAFMKRHPENPWKGRCHTIMAKAFGRLGDHRKQIEHLIQSIAADQRQMRGRPVDNSSAYWAIAYCAEFELGDFVIAREYCHKFLNEYPRDNRAFTVKQALERMDEVQSGLEQGRVTPLSDRNL